MATPMMVWRVFLHPSLPASRVAYVLKVWESLSGFQFSLTRNAAESVHWQIGPHPVLDGVPFLAAAPQWADLPLKDPPSIRYRDASALFPVMHSESLLPYDPVLAAFWVLTEAEKYAPDFPVDVHGRYDEQAMWLVRTGEIRRPVVHYWLRHLMEALGVRWRPTETLTVEWTVDVDFPWGYRHRPWWRRLGKALRNRRFPQGVDPYDVREQLMPKLPPERTTFFFLDGGAEHPWPFESAPYARMITDAAKAGYGVGLHGSLRTAEDPARLRREKERLEGVLGAAVQKNRQHFLRYRLPTTYQTLHEMGITADYTTCGAAYVGFKHGVARPVPWYDLKADCPTELTLVPTIMMDRALMRITTPEQAPALLGDLLAETRRWNGHAAVLWHNAVLSGEAEWKQWATVFEWMLRFLEEKDHER